MYAVKIMFVAYFSVKQYTIVILLIFAVINHFVINILHHHLVSSDVDIFSASNFLHFFSSNNRQS